MGKIGIKGLPRKDRPCEKCLRPRSNSLSGTELLAAILRAGSKEGNSPNLADSLLTLGNPGDGLLDLLRYSLDDFMGIKGVGKVRGVQLLCMGELSKHIWRRKASKHALYSGHPEEISDYCMEDMRHLEQGEIRIVLLSTRQAIICDQIMTGGTVNASVITPRGVLVEGLRCRAVSMVLVHNHPNGGPTPSRVDMLLIKCLKEAGELVEITLVDRVVIGDRRYLSFREENLV